MSEIPLGKPVELPGGYAPEILAPIARSGNRDVLGIDTSPLPFYGADVWNAYEVSWLNNRGMPKVATARIIFPCDTVCIVESKSLKLYLGSFNQERIDSEQTLETIITRDLSALAGQEVHVSLYPMHDLQHYLPEAPAGRCLDELDLAVSHYQVEPSLLQTETVELEAEEVLYTDLFRSNCPVTGQPDWATVTICYLGKRINPGSLLQYLVSYRQHNDYHENCVERIFCDIQHLCRPVQLVVEANFLRRGGLDINPVRSSLPIREFHRYPRYLRQ